MGGRPLAMNNRMPAARIPSRARTVEAGTRRVAKLSRVPSMSKKAALILFTGLQFTCLELVQHFPQAGATGGKQPLHLVGHRHQVGHHHSDESAGRTGPHPVVAVLQHQAAGGLHPQLLGPQQKGLGVRLGAADHLAGHHGPEVMAQPPVVQIAADHRFTAGRDHRHGDALALQPGQQLVQARLFGHRFAEGFFRQLMEAVQNGFGRAVGPAIAAQHPPQGVPRRAPGGLGQPLFI